MSEENDELKRTKDGISVVSEIMKMAGNNDNVKKASNNLGKTAVILTNTINNALLPLVAVNNTFEKAKKYFAKEFQEDISLKAKYIDQENLIEPKASIAGPAMQALTYAHEEHSLKDMYISLLSSAMNKITEDEAHPSFVEIIRQLSAQEAQELKFILSDTSAIGYPICEIRVKDKKIGSYNVIFRHFVNLIDNTNSAIPNNSFPVMVDNWIRLGLVTVDYTISLAENDAYSWVENRKEYIDISKKYNINGKELIYEKGVIVSTSFGRQFAKIVGIIE